MKVLAIDPGALRCGFSVLYSEGRDKIQYVDSGILGFTRDTKYQEYRLSLIENWVTLTYRLFADHKPTAVVNEVVPPAGGNIASIINRQLSLTVITVVQTLAYASGVGVVQLGATTVKKSIGGDGRASKVKVRDGVLSKLPSLESRRKEWTGKGAVFDEVDALAIGLTYLSTERQNGIK